MIEYIKKILEEIFMRSWWVIAFILCCYFIYEQALRARQMDHQRLLMQYQEWQREHHRQLLERQFLTAQINSQSDPDWIELTLMKELGLIAEGQIKVLFSLQKDAD